MAVSYDIDLMPPCEHVLVNTKMFGHNCQKCKRYRWPWSKAVGCIKCMNVWHRRCGPEYEDVESDDIKYIEVEKEVDDFVLQENLNDWVYTSNPKYWGSPLPDRRTSAGDAPEPSGHLLPPVSRSTRAQDEDQLLNPVTARSCLLRYLSRRSGTVPLQHSIAWPKLRLTRTIMFSPGDEANTPVFKADDSVCDVSNLVAGRFSSCHFHQKAVHMTTTLTCTRALAFSGYLLRSISVAGWLLPVALPDWIRQKIARPGTILVPFSGPFLAISEPPQAISTPPKAIIVAPLKAKPKHGPCRRPYCKSRRCRRERLLSAVHAAYNGCC